MLPKRSHGGSWIGGTPLSPLVLIDERFARADRDPNEQPDPGLPGEPHADALAIEAAVKNLTAWRGYGFGPDDPAGLMLDIEHMSIDHVAVGMEAIAAMVGSITVHSSAGTRPKWPREFPEPQADTGANGKPRVLVDEIF